jgi:GntR family transcriptional repressor for pyruvate dehydrogenase complex
LADQLVERIEALVAESRLNPGDIFPSERVLAEQFGVSRTVVREAIRALTAKGLLAVTPGSGMMISRPTAPAIAKSMRFLLQRDGGALDYGKVREVRQVLEVEIAGLAAERRTSDDLRLIESCLEQMSQAPGDKIVWAEADVAFHAALAAATHNELFVVLLESVANVMILIRQLAYDVPGAVKTATSHHQHILACVQKGDADAARAAMRAHLIASDKIMRRAQSLEGLGR